MSLQDRMVRYRAKERITQAELAKRVGVSTQTISCVENNLQDPSRVTKAKIELVVGGENDEAINQ